MRWKVPNSFGGLSKSEFLTCNILTIARYNLLYISFTTLIDGTANSTMVLRG